MAISDAKITIGLPVGATGVKEADGTAATVRYVPVGANMLSDGDFESGTADWSAISGATFFNDTGTSKVGARSLRVTRGSSDASASLASALTVYPGVTYSFGAWLLSQGGNTVQLDAYWKDSGGNTLTSVSISAATTSTSWFYRSVTGTAPPNAASVTLQFAVTSGNGWLDAVVVQPCVPLVESPYTEPSSTGTYAAGAVTYQVNGDAAHLGDVRVYDMASQTDATLAASSYTPVFGERHNFTGDVLVDNGIVRLWLKRGYSSAGAIRYSAYVNGSWQTVAPVYLDTGGDTTATISVIRLTHVSPARVSVELADTDGNKATITLRRGTLAAKIVTTRVAAVSAYQELGVAGAPRFVAYNASTVLLDDDVHASDQSIAGSSLTEPYALALDDALAYMTALGMTKKPSTLYGDDATGILWRDTAATTSAFERTFWLIIMPWPWLTNGAFFKEAESATLSGGVGTVTGHAGSSNGAYVQLDAASETASYTFIAGRDLPPGEYTMVARATDSAGVASDFFMQVYNDTEAVSIASASKTLTGSYAFYTLDFGLTAAHEGDQIQVLARKAGGAANTISLDYFLIVPRKRNSATPSHVFFPYDVARNALMDTTTRESVRRG